MKISTLLSIVFGAILVLMAVLSYFDDKPDIQATGEYSSWNTPNSVYSEINAYARLDIRNEGDSAAKEIKVLTPFRGTYLIDGTEEIKNFDNNIPLEDLNPGEGYLIEVWSENVSFRRSEDVFITHTRGKSNVDFGYQAIGTKGKILNLFDRSWFLVIFIILGFPFVVWAVIDESYKKKYSEKPKT